MFPVCEFFISWHPAKPAGWERIVQALALCHQQRGVEVHLAVILDAPDPEHPFFEPLAGSAMRVHPLPLRGADRVRLRGAAG